MADNKTPAGVAFKVATREVTYSGETADIQAVSLATVSGSDDSKTATDVSASNRVPIEDKGATTSTTATWDSSTANNTTLDVDVRGYRTVMLVMVCSAGTFTDGIVTYTGSVDGGATFPSSFAFTTYNLPTTNLSTADAFATSTTFVYVAPVAGFTHIRLTLTPAITGTGTVSIVVTASQSEPDIHLVRAQITGAATLGVAGIFANDAGASSASPLLVGGYANNAAPTDVSNNNDAVRGWFLRNGAQATVITAAGALIPGDAANGLDVDVTRLKHGVSSAATATWSSGTADETTLDLTVTGYASALLVITPDGGGASTGIIEFEAVSGAVVVPIKAATGASSNIAGAYSIGVADIAGTTSKQFIAFDVAGFDTLRFRLSTTITGAGTLALRVVASTAATTDNVIQGIADNSVPLPVAITSAGELMVEVQNSGLVSEDDAMAGDPTGHQLMARRRDSLSTETNANGDATALNSTGKGELYVKHVDSIPVTDNGTTLSVDDGASSLTIDAPPGSPAYVRLSDGSAALVGQKAMASSLPVVLASDQSALPVASHAVTNAGTFVTQENGSALTALQLIDDPVFADDAAFTVGTSKVMMAGANTVAIGADPDAADAGDAGAFLANRHRVQFVIGGHPNVVSVKATAITTAVTDSAIITISTGSKICVTRLTVTLDNASTVFPTVLIGFGTANTPTTTGVIASHGGVPAGGGFTIGDGSGVIGQGADNEDLRITTTGNATGNGLHVVVSYFLLPS